MQTGEGLPAFPFSHSNTSKLLHRELRKIWSSPNWHYVYRSLFSPCFNFTARNRIHFFRAGVLLSHSLPWILWSDNLCKTCSHAVEFLTLSIACFEFPPFLFYNHSDIKKYTQLFTTINPATISNNAMQENISQASWEMKRKVCEKSQREFKFSCWWYRNSSLNGGSSHFLWRWKETISL